MNRKLEPEDLEGLLAELTDQVAGLLGKPKQFVQIVAETGLPMFFAGTGEPTAFVELRTLGLPPDRISPLTEALCRFLHERVGTPPDRIFINYFDMPRTHWGWNNRTFA
ncbi:MAG: hypothetical protein J7M29_09010 [Verrucomicrobia bacterium]|nr:hypothetical protein [Verrucomicrobiota bacterium]